MSIMPDHIGIVACSAEGAALCYRTICVEGAQLLGQYAHPEVSMHTPSLAEYVKYLDQSDWQGERKVSIRARTFAAREPVRQKDNCRGIHTSFRHAQQEAHDQHLPPASGQRQHRTLLHLQAGDLRCPR